MSSSQTVVTTDVLAQWQNDMFSKLVLDNSNLLEELYHKLKGEIYKPVEKTYTTEQEDGTTKTEKVYVNEWQKIEGIEPEINELCLNATMNLLNLALTINNATGHIDEELARLMAFRTYDLLLKDYYLHLKEYGFKDTSTANRLAFMIMQNTYLHLSKSISMGLLKEIMRSYSINEVRNYDLEKNKQPQPQLTV